MYAKSYWASMLTWFCFCVKLRFFFFMESIKSPYNDKFEIRGFMTITRIPKTLFIQIKDGVTYLMVINQLHKVLSISSDMIQWNTSIGISMYIYISIKYSSVDPHARSFDQVCKQELAVILFEHLNITLLYPEWFKIGN